MNRRNVLIMGLSTLAASRYGTAATRSHKQDGAMSPSPTLQCSIEVADERLSLSYTVSNPGEQDIFVFTPLSAYSGGAFVPYPNRVYVFVRDKAAHLAKCVWPVPRDREVYMPEMPFLTRIRGQGSLQEKLHLPLPLLVNHPYGDDKPTMSSRMTESAIFSLGYIDAAQPVPGLEAVPGTALFKMPYGEAITRQTLLTGDPVALKLRVQG
jgi:hypothetical protein